MYYKCFVQITLLKKTEELIRKRRTAAARKVFRTDIDWQKLGDSEMAFMLRLARRLGESKFALLNVEKLFRTGPELEVERASFLGQKGAITAAIKCLDLIADDRPEFIFRKAALLTSAGQHERAFECYENVIKNTATGSYLNFAAQLNFIGSKGHKRQGLAKIASDLQKLNEKLDENEFPHLAQGTYYFIALTNFFDSKFQRGDTALKNALRIGHARKERENLQLSLLAMHFKLNPKRKALSKSELASILSTLSRLRKRAFSQSYIDFVDHIWLLYALSHHKKESAMAEKYLNEIIFCGVNNYYSRLIPDYFPNYRPTGHWEVTESSIKILAKKKTTHNHRHISQLPIIINAKGEHLVVGDLPSLQQRFWKYLICRRHIQCHEAELWTNVWNQPYSFVTTPGAIRATIFRFRRTRIKDFIQIEMIQKKIQIKLLKGTRWIE